MQIKIVIGITHHYDMKIQYQRIKIYMQGMLQEAIGKILLYQEIDTD